MVGDPGTVENSEKEAREPAHVHLVGDQASGGADRIVIGEFHARQLRTPIILALADDHSQHLCRCRSNTLHTTVTTRVTGAGSDSTNTKKVVGGRAKG